MSGWLTHRGLLLPAGVGGGGDPHWANVTSLLHFDDTDGATTFTDEAGATWTRTGNAEIDTAQSVFGGSSLFTNTTGYLGSPTSGRFDFGTGDFTVEARVRISSFSAYPNIFCNRGGAISGNDTNGIVFRVSNTGKLTFFWGAGYDQVVGSTTMSVNTWYDVSLCRSGADMRIFLDGGLEGTANVATDNVTQFGATTSFIGCYGNFGAERLPGHIDEFRATKGVARYTASYTIAASAFPDS